MPIPKPKGPKGPKDYTSADKVIPVQRPAGAEGETPSGDTKPLSDETMNLMRSAVVDILKDAGPCIFTLVVVRRTTTGSHTQNVVINGTNNEADPLNGTPAMGPLVRQLRETTLEFVLSGRGTE